MKENYGFDIFEKDFIGNMQKVMMPKFSIQGYPWYNVLNNQDYSESFGYIGAHDYNKDCYGNN